MTDTQFRSVTRRLDRDFDLLLFAGDDGWLFEHEGSGLAGRGCATTVNLPGRDAQGSIQELRKVLRTIEVDDAVNRAGTGPVAFGALPFDPNKVRQLTIPSVIVGRSSDGTRWLTTITAVAKGQATASEAEIIAQHDAIDLGSPLPPESQVDTGDIRISSKVSPDEWCQALVEGRALLGDDQPLQKFVLARELVIETQHPLPKSVVLNRLRNNFPTCYITSIDDMVGASPELLVSRQGDIVRSRPLAGTTSRSPDPVQDAQLSARLLASSKDRHEHQIVVDMVYDKLVPWCSYLDWEPEPSVLGVANVAHLATFLEGRLSSPPASAIELVTELHPTPAICGTPTDLALELINRLEGDSRGAYAGPVGWVDYQGNGDWAVGIRSALIETNTASVFAGVGVVKDSDPEAELAETRAKFQAILQALLRP